MVRKLTGDEEYEFGDLTKRAMSDADRMVSNSLGDLSQAMLGFRLTGAQERALFTGIITKLESRRGLPHRASQQHQSCRCATLSSCCCAPAQHVPRQRRPRMTSLARC